MTPQEIFNVTLPQGIKEKKQICIQLPKSAENVTLLAFAADRCAGEFAVAAPGDISYPPGAQQQTRRSGRQTGQTVGHRTVTQTPLHAMRTVSIRKTTKIKKSNRSV